MSDSRKASGSEAVGVARLSVVSNTVLVVLKLSVGIAIGSVSVISEAIHSGIDLVAALIAWFAVRQASKPADEDHPYGHGKFENASGTIEAILIFVAAAWIVVEAIHKFKNPASVEEPAIGVALMLLSAVLNWIVSGMLFRTGKKAQSVALEADAWHLRTDVYTSLGVMAGLAGIWVGSKIFPGVNLQWLDPLAAIGVALLIVKAAWDLTLQAARDLFDVSLPENEVEWIKATLRSHGEVKGFHDLRTRKSGKDRFIEFHMVVEPHLSVLKSHELTDEVQAAIEKQLHHSHVMIHVEPCGDDFCTETCLSECFAELE